jgi:hypothetical protein
MARITLGTVEEIEQITGSAEILGVVFSAVSALSCSPTWWRKVQGLRGDNRG